MVYITTMRVELNDEQQFLCEAVAGATAREAPLATVREWTQSGDLAGADAIAIRQGWSGIGLAEEAGGQGGGVIELAVLAEQLGRGAVPWDRTLAGCVTARLLAACATPAALELARQSAGGERVAVLAADARRPLAAPAVTSSDGRLSGEIHLVAGAPSAETLIVPIARGDSAELLSVRAGGEGCAVRPRRLVDRTRGLARVTLRDAPAQPLGDVSPEALAEAASTAALLIAADALGAAGRMLDMTMEYVVERKQFGVPVGSFQAVKHAAAEMLVDVEASRSAVHHGAWAVQAGIDGELHAAIAKSHSCEAAARVADKALFLHGAVGYTWEHDLQLLFKRAKSDVLMFGSPDAHRDVIARELALLPAGGAARAA